MERLLGVIIQPLPSLRIDAKREIVRVVGWHTRHREYLASIRFQDDRGTVEAGDGKRLFSCGL